MKLMFSQEWLDRASREDRGELVASGPISPISEASADIASLVNKFAASSAAREMIRRGWITLTEKSEKIPVITKWFEVCFNQTPVLDGARMFRGSAKLTTLDVIAQLASFAWISRVSNIANQQSVSEFNVEKLDNKELKKLTSLSALPDGPVRVMDWMRRHGIHFVIEPSLPGMHLDGAALKLIRGNPLIALTLRYDRLDNFWFTVLHEVAHIKKHFIELKNQVFLDDFEETSARDEIEAEADAFARDAFIPRDVWRRSDAYRFRTKPAILSFAKKLGIHPAIIAGRLRYETNDYSLFTELVGQDVVGNMFIQLGG